MRLLVLVLAAACAGCESWTGFGFRDQGGEMGRLREVLALERGKVVADIGAGKGVHARLGEDGGPRLLNGDRPGASGASAKRWSRRSSTM